jgi:hypothetical protein
MKDQLTKSILDSFEHCLKLVTGICESEIEKIFLLKIIDHVQKRADRYGLSFIITEALTGFVNGDEVITSSVNYQMEGDFGYICGIRITNFINQTNIEIFPQKKVEFMNPENIMHNIRYRLDFGIYKYNFNETENKIKKYCVECDGYDFHSTKDQIKRDNERMRNLLLQNGFITLRYLGTEIHNWDDVGIGNFIWNL